MNKKKIQQRINELKSVLESTKITEHTAMIYNTEVDRMLEYELSILELILEYAL